MASFDGGLSSMVDDPEAVGAAMSGQFRMEADPFGMLPRFLQEPEEEPPRCVGVDRSEPVDDVIDDIPLAGTQARPEIHHGEGDLLFQHLERSFRGPIGHRGHGASGCPRRS